MRTFGNICIIIFVILTVYTLRGDLTPLAQQIGVDVEHSVQMLGQEGTGGGIAQPLPENNSQLAKEISTPGPLQVTGTSTAAGSGTDVSDSPDSENAAPDNEAIIVATNAARKENGNLPPLAENATLDATALRKDNDLFKNQYFAHTSPSGMTIATEADDAGYDYILIGENLALGNFDSMQAIVDAWMGSPGHRANILNKYYTQIGVSVESGTYKGETVLIAVQHFGLPGSACPSVDASLKATVGVEQNAIDQLNTQVAALKEQITASSQFDPGYSGLINTYNNLVDQYNSDVLKTKSDITTYNSEVTAHNTCLQGFTS